MALSFALSLSFAVLLLLLPRFYCAGQRSTPHYRTLEVRPGRIKLELKYDYDCERDIACAPAVLPVQSSYCASTCAVHVTQPILFFVANAPNHIPGLSRKPMVDHIGQNLCRPPIFTFYL